eukprot:m.7062 g.7062  ORF g.7062 m.7062 type:complete len:124 (+) comp17622_c0_seq1:211-582(+)
MTIVVSWIRALEGILQTILILKMAAEWRNSFEENKRSLNLSKIATALVFSLDFGSYFVDMLYDAHFDAPNYRAQLDIFGEETWRTINTSLFPLIMFFRLNGALFFIQSFNKLSERCEESRRQK